MSTSTKAGIDQLVPGWVKPAGRTAKLSFTMVEGASTELRDLQLDSGATQMRGSATMTADGALDKADLSTLQDLRGRRHARPAGPDGRRLQGRHPGQYRRRAAVRQGHGRGCGHDQRGEPRRQGFRPRSQSQHPDRVQRRGDHQRDPQGLGQEGQPPPARHERSPRCDQSRGAHHGGTRRSRRSSCNRTTPDRCCVFSISTSG